MEDQVKHDGSGKFYIELDGEDAVIQYKKFSENGIDFQHTYVPKTYRGKGVAERIARTALNYAREKKFKVLPSCRFMKAFIRRNKEYQGLL